VQEPVANLDELRQRVAKYMQLEELREFMNQVRVATRGDKGKDKEKERLNRLVVGREDRHRENREPQFMRYTPLSDDRGEFWTRP